MRHRTHAEQLALFARIAEVSATVTDINEQAAAVGLKVSVLYVYRCKAKAAGFAVDRPAHNRRRKVDRLKEIDRELSGPGCRRCFLHGPHLCREETFLAMMDRRISQEAA